MHDIIRAEASDPLPYKEDGDRRIYGYRNFGHPKSTPGYPKISDFGVGVKGHVSKPHNHDIQPNLCQAPEVILRATWSYSADIWNLGVMVSLSMPTQCLEDVAQPTYEISQLWDLAENETLFSAEDSIHKEYSLELHLAEMIGYLGPPPDALLRRGIDTGEFLNEDGKMNPTLPAPFSSHT